MTTHEEPQQLTLGSRFLDRQQEQLARTEREQAFMLAKELALVVFPLRATAARDRIRRFSLGRRVWCEIAVTRDHNGTSLPYGALDRAVLAGMIDLAVNVQRHPLVTIRDLLKHISRHVGGSQYARIYDSVIRLMRTQMVLRLAESREALLDPTSREGGQFLRLIEHWNVPGVSPNIGEDYPEIESGEFWVQLGPTLWDFACISQHQLWVNVDHLQRFSRHPTAWDLYALACYRCGAAEQEHVIGWETLVELFSDHEHEPPSAVFRRLRIAEAKVHQVTGGELDFTLEECDPVPTGGRGRPLKPMQMRIRPSRHLISAIRPPARLLPIPRPAS